MNNNTKLRKERNNENKKVLNAPFANGQQRISIKPLTVFSGKFYVMHEKKFYLH